MNSTPLFGFFSSLLWLCVSCNEYLTGLWRELFGVPSYFHVVTGPLPSRLSGLRPQPHCDHQRTTAAVREGDLKVKPLVDSAKLNKISSSQPLLNKYMVWWRPEERHTVIFIFSWSLTMLFFPLLYVIFSLDRSTYQINITFIYFCVISFFCCFCGISPSVHLSISLSFKDSRVSSVLFPVSQTPAQTNIALLLAVNPSVDLALSNDVYICLGVSLSTQ